MQRLRALLLAFGLCITATMARADEHPGQVMVFGSGTASCGSWMLSRNNYENDAWIFGFLTAYNMYLVKRGTTISAGTDASGPIGWVDNYCRAHPLDSIFDAAVRLVEELQRRMAPRN